MSDETRDPREDNAEKSVPPVPAGMGVPMEEDVIGSVDASVPEPAAAPDPASDPKPAADPADPAAPAPADPVPSAPSAHDDAGAGDSDPDGPAAATADLSAAGADKPKRRGSTAKRVLAFAAVVAFAALLTFGPSVLKPPAADAPATAEQQQEEAEREEEAAASTVHTGERPLVLVVVGFDGDESGQGACAYRDDFDWHKLAFEDADGVSAYYTGQSTGSFTWVPATEKSAYGTDGNTCVADSANDGIVHVRLPRAHGHWFAADSSELSGEDAAAELADDDFDACVRQAVTAAEKYVDLGSYDKDGDGLLGNREMGVGVIMAGFERDGDWMTMLDDGEFPRMQAHAKWFGSAGRKSGLAAFPKDTIVMGEQVTRVPESRVDDAEVDRSVLAVEPNSLGTMCHELAHNLGLPDYYDIDYLEDEPWVGWTPGYLSIMDIGSLARVSRGDGTFAQRPSAFDPYSLAKLGWLEPQEVTASGTYEVRAAGAEGGKSVLRIENGTPGEYFLIENREATGQDEGLLDAFEDASLGTGALPDGSSARGGIVVWHVDERVFADQTVDNTVNLATHRPGITVQYLMATDWENPTAGHTLDFALEEVPDVESAFWSASLARKRYDELGVGSFQLWRYGDGSAADDTNARAYIGAHLDFADEPGPVMHVRVEIGS